jgi:hypothetical protein
MRTLWESLYGGGEVGGYVGLFSGVRPAPGDGRLLDPRQAYFEYPGRAREAEAWCTRRSSQGREVYFCAHLLTARRRTKGRAAPVRALWADADGASLPTGTPGPTAVVESSPGRRHLFWRLSRPLPPSDAEALNRRLSYAVGADRSGWDLGQLLRPPGTRNHKYRPAAEVRLLKLDHERYHPRELGLALPPGEPPRTASSVRRPAGAGRAVDLSRLTERTRGLISDGNCGAGSPYPSRSEADFAVCLAMFVAGYREAEVWAVMTDPAHGISEKYRHKGRHGDAYLALTVGKARVLSTNPARSRASSASPKPGRHVPPARLPPGR